MLKIGTNNKPLKKSIISLTGLLLNLKLKKKFANIHFHEKDFGIKAKWHFYATSHGKGICYGFGVYYYESQ